MILKMKKMKKEQEFDGLNRKKKNFSKKFQGKSIKEIASLHKRRIGGINSRLLVIASELYLKNVPMKEIVKRTTLKIEEIESSISKRKNAKETREKRNSPLKELEKIMDILWDIKREVKNIRERLDNLEIE